MNILFALSQIEVTGAETYAMTLAEGLRELEHSIVFVSDRLNNPGTFRYFPLPIHANNTSTLGRIQNVISIRSIIKSNQISLVHSHSRAANLVSFFATGKSIAQIVTVHGRWRNHFAFRTLPCLGQKTIAVCPSLKRYLVQEIGIPEKNVLMIPNGIDCNQFIPSNASISPKTLSKKNILFVGRFSGQKGNVIRYLIKNIYPQILKKFPDVTFQIMSSLPTEKDIELIQSFNHEFRNSIIEICDSKKDLISLYQSSHIVVGSGRVAMEAMACEKPVITIGESSAPGLLNEKTFNSAFDSNFGDCGEWNLFLKENSLLKDFYNLLSDSDLQKNCADWGRKKAVHFFSKTTISKQVEDVYKSL